MRADQIENKRYLKSNHCNIKLEENLMFYFLKKFTDKNKRKPNEIKILDIGCGSGMITKKIMNLGYIITGLDFSKEAVSKALEAGVNAKLCNLDEGISEASESFDVIWAGDVIEHVFDPINLLIESSRVLKKNGIILLTTPNNLALVSRIKTLFGISYQEEMYKKSGHYKHHTFFSFSLIKFMLTKAGFEILDFNKILQVGDRRIHVHFVPSLFYNVMVIKAIKKK